MAAILHKVKRGETTLSICLMYGITYDYLVHLNERFLGVDALDVLELRTGDMTVVGDSADPIDLVRVLSRRGKL